MKKIIFNTILLILLLGSISVSAKTYGVFTYDDDDDIITITDCKASAAGRLVIPDTIDGMPVTIIDTDAFRACNNLTSVTVPNSVSTINDSAFRNCAKLESVTIGSGVTEIGRNVFSSCPALKTVHTASNAVLNYSFPSDVSVIFESELKPELVLLNMTADESSYTYSFSMESVSSLSGELIVCLYSADGRLESVRTHTVTSVNGYCAEDTLATVNPAAYWKVLLWNSRSSLTPICSAADGEITITK